MKINECKSLISVYGENATLKDVLKQIQGNKIHRCPKCGGSGMLHKRRNTAQYWECCDRWEYYDVECDLCGGEGYTEHEYKPRMVQDGWE